MTDREPSHREHVSFEAGHSAGLSRVVLTVGLLLIGVGIVAFLAGILIGMNNARSGVVGSEGSLWLLPVGGLSVVVGLLVAALGMGLARRAAGE